MATGQWRILAGGTDLYPAEKGRALTFPVLDLAGLDGLRGIAATDDGLRIGACTTWADIARTPLPPALAALQQAAVEVGGPQVQTAGTLGGNLCNASPAADGVPPLLACDAKVELASRRGTRQLALSDYLTGPRRTLRAPDEILTAILIPQSGLAGRSRFLKLGARRYLVISIAMVAVRLAADAGRITEAAVSVGACSATARRLAAVEAALAGRPPHQAAAAVRDADVAARLAPMDDLRASAAYRATAAAELIRRALSDLASSGASEPAQGAA